MTNKALDTLIEAVEAGTIALSDLDAFIPSLGLNTQGNDAHSAYRGDLNAAKALHEALLVNEDPQYGYLVGPQYARIVHPSGYLCDATADNPARAWLLAILKAYRTQVTQ